MGAIVLNGAATKAWEHFAVKRTALDERITQLVDEADALEEDAFLAMMQAQGLNPELGWEVIEDHYEDFGVVLVRQMDSTPTDDEDLDPEQLPGAP